MCTDHEKVELKLDPKLGILYYKLQNKDTLKIYKLNGFKADSKTA